MVKELQNMVVTSVRVGFATNSSSSHSVIYDAGRTQKQVDEMLANYEPRSGESEFGWSEYHYCDENSIINYAIMVHFPLYVPYGTPKGSERKYLSDIVDALLAEGEIDDLIYAVLWKFVECYMIGGSYAFIDHQSCYSDIMSSSMTKGANFREYIRTVSEIITGNDNV